MTIASRYNKVNLTAKPLDLRLSAEGFSDERNDVNVTLTGDIVDESGNKLVDESGNQIIWELVETWGFYNLNAKQSDYRLTA